MHFGQANIKKNLLTLMVGWILNGQTYIVSEMVALLIKFITFYLGILIPIILLSEISTIKTRSSLSNTCNLAINFGALVITLL